MLKREALDRLHVLIMRSAELQQQRRFSEEFQRWQENVRVVLKHAFPNEPEYVRDFDNIRYSLRRYSNQTPDSERQEAYVRGLTSARAFLQARMDEITEFWNEQGATVAAVTPEAPENPGLVFVIHGRQFVGEFHDFLRAIGLKPLEWSQARRLTNNPNPFTWEIVDTALRKAGAIVALMTPDDEARLAERLWGPHENALEMEYLPQPRQNVLFEAGVAYGRAPRRTVLVRIGSHRPMSDLAGHHILQLDDSPQARQAVADALRSAGCPIDLTGSDWFKAGDFTAPK